MKKTIGYIRVSTDKQSEKGMSLEVQQEKITAMARIQDIPLDEIIIDAGESAGSLKRPGMKNLVLMVLTDQISTVIITKLDRLTRSIRDLVALIDLFERKDVKLLSVSDSLDTKTASGRLVINIMMAVLQWEREVLVERTTEVIRSMKEKNRRVGFIPYGYTLSPDQKHIEEDPSEQAITEKISTLRKKGKTLDQIARELNKEKLTTRRGTPWNHTTVLHILQPQSRCKKKDSILAVMKIQ